MMDENCIFCKIAYGQAPADYVEHNDEDWPVVIIRPLNPVVEGHVMVIPREHVSDFAEDEFVSAYTFRDAARYAQQIGACNIISSRGADATQSVYHLHVHVVPRNPGDGLALPWDPQGRQQHR